jgi:hypothetical protein
MEREAVQHLDAFGEVLSGEEHRARTSAKVHLRFRPSGCHRVNLHRAPVTQWKGDLDSSQPKTTTRVQQDTWRLCGQNLL